MARSLAHRGPDDEGFYRDTSIALGMTRLSIIDLETGLYPIRNEDDTLVLICNGEIYVIEVNPRASRTVPYVSKSTGVPLAKIAVGLMTGKKLADYDLTLIHI